MKNPTVTTFFTSNSILSKLNAYNTEYSVFTMDYKLNGNRYQSTIKFAQNNKTLWTLDAFDTEEALANHITLVNMARKNSVLTWNEKILEQSKPLQQVEALHKQKIVAKKNSFICSYSNKLFEATDLNATHSEIENDNKIAKSFIAALALASLGFWITCND